LHDVGNEIVEGVSTASGTLEGEVHFVGVFCVILIRSDTEKTSDDGSLSCEGVSTFDLTLGECNIEFHLPCSARYLVFDLLRMEILRESSENMDSTSVLDEEPGRSVNCRVNGLEIFIFKSSSPVIDGILVSAEVVCRTTVNGNRFTILRLLLLVGGTVIDFLAGHDVVEVFPLLFFRYRRSLEPGMSLDLIHSIT